MCSQVWIHKTKRRILKSHPDSYTTFISLEKKCLNFQTLFSFFLNQNVGFQRWNKQNACQKMQTGKTLIRLLRPMVKEEMHLQENTLFDL